MRGVDEALKAEVLHALERIDWQRLTNDQRLDLLRVYAVTFVRMGRPDDLTRERLIARLDSHYPAHDQRLNAELCQTLVYLEAPTVVRKTLKLLAEAPTQEEQIEYAKSLRVLKNGWTLDERKVYFSWFPKAARFAGGASLRGFLRNIKRDALATLTDQEKLALKPILEAGPGAGPALVAKPRPFVKKWTVDELVPVVEKALTSKRNFDRGRSLFGAANCFACHRFASEGGAQGPDLTGVSGRFSVRDLLESIVEPSKEISDQYAAVMIATTDGKLITGRIVNLDGNRLHVMTDMLDPNKQAVVDHSRVESMQLSKISMMPEGLLDTFKKDEIADLFAYMLSRGDRNDKMFK